MTDRHSDEKLVDFLQQYRPDIPEAAPDLEQKLLAALETNQVDRPQVDNCKLLFDRRDRGSRIASIPKWAFPPAIVASLLVSWSSYRLLIPAPIHADEAARLEAFLINNWEGVAHCPSEEIAGDRPTTDWLNLAVTDDTEPLTNN
ncbi:MAG: hypothetical protein ACRC62_38945 [Microcoleus sp.]